MTIPNKLNKAQRQGFAEAHAYGETMTYLSVFKPNPGGQERFFHSTKHQIIGSGGNKGGKTFSGIVKGALSSIPEKDIHNNQTGYMILPQPMKDGGYTQKRVPRHKIQAFISSYSQPVQQRTVQPVVDDIFGPYIKDKYTEKGCHHWIETDIAHIDFVWQKAEHASYTGANLDWAMLDEPHARKIYYEVASRMIKTQGRMWTMMTPVIDAKDPDVSRKMRFIKWMIEELVLPFEEDPGSVPNVDVIYIDVEENPHVNIQFALDQWASLSPEERLIRKTGKFVEFLGACAFDEQHLRTLTQYLRERPEESQPRYGYLEYDDRETSDEWVIRFVESAPSFADEPGAGWMWKIWEEPIDPLHGVAPKYAIGADVAEGKEGKDYTAVYVKRCDTGRTVAALHGYISEIDLARQLWLGGHYYCERTGFEDDEFRGRKPAKLGIENVNFGRTTLAYLQTGHEELEIPKYGVDNLYRQPSQAMLDRGKSVPGDRIGWYTSSHSRPHLVTSMRENLLASCHAIDADEPPNIVDLGWLREAKTFILDSTGKYKAAPGFYDDKLIASAICDQVVAQVRSREHTWIPRQERGRVKDLYYFETKEDGTLGDIIFNVQEAKSRSYAKKNRVAITY